MNSTLPLRLTCPLCKADVYARRDQSGQVITCPECLEEFAVSEPTPEPPPAPETDLPLTDDPDPQGRLLIPDIKYDSPLDRSPTGDTSEISPGATTAPTDEWDGDYEFDIECLICGTRLDATNEQIGTEIPCPDCYTKITIRTPPPKARRKPFEAKTGANDEIRLSKLDEAPPVQSPAPSALDAAEAEASQADPQVSVTRKSAQETMARARQEVEEETRPDIPKNPFTTNIFLFLFDPSAVLRCFILALTLQIEFAAIVTAVRFMSGGPQAQFTSALLMAFSVLFGLVTFSAWSATMLTVLQETANGNDRIENWPENNISEWIADVAYVFSALFVGLLPSALLGQIFFLAGGDAMDHALGIATLFALSAFLIFPVALVSSLETGSPVNLVSRPVWKSLILVPHRWAQFFLLAAGLALLFLAVSWARELSSTLVNYLVYVVQMMIMMLYFRLLGRLTWCCQEAVGEAGREQETSPDEE